MSVLATSPAHLTQPLFPRGFSDEARKALHRASAASRDEDNPSVSSYLSERKEFDPSLLADNSKQDDIGLSPLRDATTIRLLALLSKRPGAWSIRILVAATGMCKKSVERAIVHAEAEGLLKVDHGRSDFDPDGPRMNGYKVTALGIAQIPRVLRDADLSGDFSLESPIWHQTDGYGLVGLILTLELKPGGEATTKEIATLLGTSPRSAANIMKRLMAKGGWLLSRYDGRFEIADHCEPKHWASVPMEEQAEERRAKERFRRTKARFFHMHDQRVANIVWLEPLLIEWVANNVPLVPDHTHCDDPFEFAFNPTHVPLDLGGRRTTRGAGEQPPIALEAQVATPPSDVTSAVLDALLIAWVAKNVPLQSDHTHCDDPFEFAFSPAHVPLDLSVAWHTDREMVSNRQQHQGHSRPRQPSD